MSNIIIVIDDSETIRAQVKLVLDGAGYAVLEAEDGIQGAALIRDNPGAVLTICDVNMPRMSGLDMLEHVKTLALSHAPPVLMLTTEGRPDLIDRARAAGAKGWIVKPFKPNMLLATVKKIVSAAA
jgi:two-component system chemotaxis response regulator CheY